MFLPHLHHQIRHAAGEAAAVELVLRTVHEGAKLAEGGGIFGVAATEGGLQAGGDVTQGEPLTFVRALGLAVEGE